MDVSLIRDIRIVGLNPLGSPPINVRSINVSAISLKPTKRDKASNAEKLEAFFVEVAKGNPQLILATEGVLEGYVVSE